MLSACPLAMELSFSLIFLSFFHTYSRIHKYHSKFKAKLYYQNKQFLKSKILIPNSFELSTFKISNARIISNPNVEYDQNHGI